MHSTTATATVPLPPIFHIKNASQTYYQNNSYPASLSSSLSASSSSTSSTVLSIFKTLGKLFPSFIAVSPAYRYHNYVADNHDHHHHLIVSSASFSTNRLFSFFLNYRSHFYFLHQLLKDNLDSYLSHILAFYYTICSSLYSHLPPFTRYPIYLFSQSLHRIIRRIYSLTRFILSSLNYLIAPQLFLRLLYRQILALLFFFLLHLSYQLCLQPLYQSLYNYIRTFFIHPSYLHRESYLLQRMLKVSTYNEWKHLAQQLDKLQGLTAWKQNARSQYYDWHRIRDDLAQFRHMVDRHDIKSIMSYSRARLYRNLVGINDRRLYGVLRAGTKTLIEEYISEVVRALTLVCIIKDDSVSAADKLAFFNETRHAFGRSALLLSGGATMGLYHTGVIKALIDNHLLPRVLSGASVGSIVVAMLGTRNDEEIATLFDVTDNHHNNRTNELQLNFFPDNMSQISWTAKIKKIMTTGSLMDINVLRECVRANVSNKTFQEAYDHSGRIINIVVSPAITSGNQDSSRLLNYLTAPNVLVWSAALASCAIPGIYAPVELMCKDENGLERPYLEGNVKWEDGSVQADLPMERLRELFNINHFIVSQVNPHVIPFLSSSYTAAVNNPSLSSISNSSSLSILPSIFSAIPKLIDFFSSSIKSTVLNLIQSGIFPYQSPLRFMLDQTYVGDITIVPPMKGIDYTLLLENPTQERLRDCLRVGEVETWKMLAMIRGACEIEMALDDGVRRMRGALIAEEVEESREMQKLTRVRSWSADFELSQPQEDGCGDEDRQQLLLAKQAKVIRPHALSSVLAAVSPSNRDRSMPETGVFRPSRSRSDSNSSSSSPPSVSGGMIPAAPIRSITEPTTIPPAHFEAPVLHLPSTNSSTTSHISALAGQNAVAALTQPRVAESVAHAYVLGHKSFKRAAQHQQDSLKNSRAKTTQTSPRFRRTVAHTMQDHRSKTPPPTHSDEHKTAILTHQSTARLQQLLKAGGGNSHLHHMNGNQSNNSIQTLNSNQVSKGVGSITNNHMNEEDQKYSFEEVADNSGSSLSFSSSLSPTSHLSRTSSFVTPSHSAPNAAALCLPPPVKFRYIEPRHMSNMDLMRLNDDREEGEDMENEEEEEEEDQSVEEENETEAAEEAKEDKEEGKEDSLRVSVTEADRGARRGSLGFLASFWSFFHPSTSPLRRPHSASAVSHHSRHASPNSANHFHPSMAPPRTQSASALPIRSGMSRNLSLNELASDLTSLP